MARKGIAVSQIILLVLGILVLAVVAYLLYTNFVGSTTAINAETCRASATRACTACSISQASSCGAAFLDLIGVGCAQHGRVNGIAGTCTTDQAGKETCTPLPSGATISCNTYVGGGTGGGVTPATTPTPPPTVTPPPAGSATCPAGCVEVGGVCQKSLTNTDKC